MRWATRWVSHVNRDPNSDREPMPGTVNCKPGVGAQYDSDRGGFEQARRVCEKFEKKEEGEERFLPFFVTFAAG